MRVVAEGDLRDEAFAKQAVQGAEALIHLAPLDPDLPADVPAQERLDAAGRGTYVLLNAALDAGVWRVVLGSTLAIMERYPASWAVNESWQPLPDVEDARQLAAYLAEESVKQFARVEQVVAICLRFGEVVTEASSPQTSPGLRPPSPTGRGPEGNSQANSVYSTDKARAVHVEDAVQAVRRALEVTPGQRPPREDGAPERVRQGWWVFHVTGAGRGTRFPIGAAANAEGGLGYVPQHSMVAASGGETTPGAQSDAEATGDLALLGPRRRIASRPIRSVVVFGAGGPLAAVTAKHLVGAYRLRLTDVRPLEEIVAQAQAQSPGAPLPQVFGAPHETQVVDVSQLDQVLRACEGMDAIVNCTVVRPHPVNAFQVNFIGAYNVMRAAVVNDIRRVVHTGPFQVGTDRAAGYWWDFDVPDEAPARPGPWLYGHSKYLGQEVVRLFAEQYDLEAPALFFCNFINPDVPRERAGGLHPMTVSWEDAGAAMRRALEAPQLPSPFEIMHVFADLPHGKYTNAKAKRLLGWQPRDSLAHFWARRA